MATEALADKEPRGADDNSNNDDNNNNDGNNDGGNNDGNDNRFRVNQKLFLVSLSSFSWKHLIK